MKGRATSADEDWIVVMTTDHGGKGTGHGKGEFDLIEQPGGQGLFDKIDGIAAPQGAPNRVRLGL